MIARLKMRLVKASDRWHFCLMGARTTDKELDSIFPKDSEEDICHKTATGADEFPALCLHLLLVLLVVRAV